VTGHPTFVESVLRHHRATLAVILIVIPLACWTWTVLMARDMYGPMSGASAWMMTAVWDRSHLALLWAMWAVMMAAMMLPSASPFVLLYARASRRAIQVYALAGGYVVVWALFSGAATMVQRLLARLLWLTPMMEPATPVAAAVVLLVAGAYQVTPWKRACLQSCRAPVAFLTRHWRTGVGGAFRMGAVHGAYCLGCCWALMLILFAGGVMNLAVITGLTVWVLIEKLAPFGQRSARVSGALLIVIAGWILWR
jgi:predicted metal-binding membrane protein